MLGRKPTGDKRPAKSSAPVQPRSSKESSKKRKWQEELTDEESDAEGKITKDDMDAWRRTIAEEERQEQLEREKQETQEREIARRRREAEEVEQKKKDEEEAVAMRDAEEARRAAEEAEIERRRQEAETAFVPAGPLPFDLPGAMPAGVRQGKEHLYKTMYCKRWEQGNCQFGAACHFAHGERELRGRPPKGSPPGTMSVPLPDEIPKPSPNRGLPAGNVPQIVPPGLAPGGQMPPGMAQAVRPPGPGMQMQRPAMQPHEAAAALNLLSTLLAANSAGRGRGVGPQGP